MFGIQSSYVVVPQFLYNLFVIGGGAISLIMTAMLARCFVFRKARPAFPYLLLILFLSKLLFQLSVTGKICSHMMIGG